MVDQTPGGSLSNADFRKLLSTPRAGSGAATPLGAKPTQTPKRADDAKAKKPYRPKPKPKAGDEKEEGDIYRDRAEERRRGINPDYVSANKLLNVIGSDGGVDTSKLSIEDTKYLGGDLDHTHLVKGLDFALLQKTRSSTEKSKQEGEQGEDSVAKSGQGPDGKAAAGGAQKREELSIRHAVAQGVFNTLFPVARAQVYEQFLPRRMAFVYEFEADENGQMAEAVFAKVDTAVIQRIAKIMSYIKTTAGGKKIRKKERDELLGELIKAGAPAGPGGTLPSGAGGQRPATATVKMMAQAMQFCLAKATTATATADAAAAAAATAAATATAPATVAAITLTFHPSAAQVEEQEEDIFGEAGTDYKPSVAAKPKPSVAATAYNAEDMDLEEGEMTAPGAAWAAGQGPLLGPTPPPAAGGDQGYSDPYTVQQQQAYALGGQQGVQLWQGQPGQEGHAMWSERDGYGQQDAAMGYGQQVSAWLGQVGLGEATCDAVGSSSTAAPVAAHQRRTSRSNSSSCATARAIGGQLKRLAWLAASSVVTQLGFHARLQAEGPKWRVRAKKTEERMVDYVDDAYGEFYQLAQQAIADAAIMMMQGGSEVPTLEDDDDIPDPKAALKAAKGDARTAGRGDKEGVREDKAKVNTQLQKIETLLKDKGHDHSGAFGRTPSRKISTGDDPSITPAHGKKRRI
ncbi:hypothetical protein QJQ45_004632 [Haematococcus lacustris]|nr:hypothetical protein QJQ45_004632 [Haematococcus lacustris]